MLPGLGGRQIRKRTCTQRHRDSGINNCRYTDTGKHCSIQHRLCEPSSGRDRAGQTKRRRLHEEPTTKLKYIGCTLAVSTVQVQCCAFFHKAQGDGVRQTVRGDASSTPPQQTPLPPSGASAEGQKLQASRPTEQHTHTPHSLRSLV